MLLFRDKQGFVNSATPRVGPLIVPCVATTTNRQTYQICACHLGIRQTLWADQNMVLLLIHTHLLQEKQPFS